MEQDESDAAQRVHPQGSVPARDREEVSASARVLGRARRGQGGEGLAAAQLHHLSLGLALDRPNAPKSAWAHFEETGRIEWITDLAEIPGKYGVTNVYGDLGQLFAWTTTANLLLGAAVMGTLVKGLGADHVVWGTDAGCGPARLSGRSEALRRLEIPEDMQKKYGYKPLGPADGSVKNANFGGNNARLYHFKPKMQPRWRPTGSVRSRRLTTATAAIAATCISVTSTSRPRDGRKAARRRTPARLSRNASPASRGSACGGQV